MLRKLEAASLVERESDDGTQSPKVRILNDG
jgi:hypothetical protein